MELTNNQSGQHRLVKAYSPGMGSIADLVQTLTDFGWRRYLPEKVTSYDVKTSSEDLIAGKWDLVNPGSRIRADVTVQRIEGDKYFVSMYMTNDCDYRQKRAALVDIRSIPAFVLRHFQSEIDKNIHGLTDPGHLDVYSANIIG